VVICLGTAWSRFVVPVTDSVSSKESTPQERSAAVREHALALGFDLVGIAPPAAGVAHERYADAMSRGFGADMDWLRDNPEVRSDVREIHPTARSVVMLGVSYWSDTPGYLEAPPDEGEGWIARYAQGKDYHVVLRRRLIQLVKAFEADPRLGYPSVAHRIFVDTGPVLEKAFAQRAGLGWIGKNTLLLNQDLGSWLFLATVLTPLELALDEAGVDHCGSCTRCLDACPTDAFPEPYVLDARRCIATWTIESHEPSRDIVPEQLGGHLFGCDICQEVCPWNRSPVETSIPSLAPRPENQRPSLATLKGLDEVSFKARFPRSAVRRTDPGRMEQVIDALESNRSGAGAPRTKEKAAE
jgi:epoxyqueuosine reductase